MGIIHPIFTTKSWNQYHLALPKIFKETSLQLYQVSKTTMQSEDFSINHRLIVALQNIIQIISGKFHYQTDAFCQHVSKFHDKHLLFDKKYLIKNFGKKICNLFQNNISYSNSEYFKNSN